MKKKVIAMMLVLAFVITMIPANALAAVVEVENADVYYNRVSGYATPGSTVELYRGSRRIGSDVATSDGKFEISNDFGYYDDRYDGRYWDGYYYGLDPRDYSTYEDYQYAMSRKYPELTNSEISDIYYGRYRYDGRYWNDRYWDGRYYKYYDDISDYYLIATKDRQTSRNYYLKNASIRDEYYYRDGYYRYPHTPRYTYDSSFTILEANAGFSIIRGTGAVPYSVVVARDSNNVELGRTDVGSDGKFVIATNRPIRSGEVIKAISSSSDYADKVTSYVVSTVTKVTAPEYNYKNLFTIGSQQFIQTVNGVSTTKYMDVAPYITNGRTMLPLRYAAESLGYTVTFDEATRNAVFVSGANTAIVNLNSRDFYVNGEKFTLTVDPITVSGRIMLPVSEIGRALGLTQGNIGDGKNIEWDGVNQVVVIQVKN